jgi:hypothetical protein
MSARTSRSASESTATLLSDLKLARDFLRVVALTGASSDSLSDNITAHFLLATEIDDSAGARFFSVFAFVGASSR